MPKNFKCEIATVRKRVDRDQNGSAVTDIQVEDPKTLQEQKSE